METKNSYYYGMVDLLRLVFAIAVMMIHTMALESISKDLWIATSMGICSVFCYLNKVFKISIL
ncbi:hypothetical protein [Clostridium botulinum]|nr:hypothetical protein [Clostridium botulinum]